MTPLVGNRPKNFGLQSQKSVRSNSRSTKDQTQIDYSSMGKSSQPLFNLNTSSRKSIQNISESLAAKRQKYNFQKTNFNLILGQEKKPENDPLESDLQHYFESSSAFSGFKASTPLQQRVRSPGLTKEDGNSLKIKISRQHNNIVEQFDNSTSFYSNKRPVTNQNPSRINISSQQIEQQQENDKQIEHFNSLISHLTKLQRLKANHSSLIKFRNASQLQKSTTLINTMNENGTNQLDLTNGSINLNSMAIRSQTPFSNRTVKKQIQSNTVNVSNNITQRGMNDYSQQQQNTINPGNHSFIRRNFYIMKQSPGKNQKEELPNPTQNPFFQSGIDKRGSMIGKRKMNDSDIQSQRMSERMSFAFSKLYNPGVKQNDSVMMDDERSQLLLPKNKKVFLNHNRIMQQNAYSTSNYYENRIEKLKDELNNIGSKEETKESCIIPNLPNLDYGLTQNQVFADFIRELKKEFTGETLSQEPDQLFNGHYVNDKAKGIGKLIDKQGNVYKGNFQEGMKKGPGIQLFMEEEHKFNAYKGEWLDDKPNGKGIYYEFKNNIFIEGIFKDGMPDSNGNFKIRYPNGDVYEGNFQNRKKNGKGKLYYTNGDLYEGEWVNNKREGKGKFYIKNEDIQIEGVFVNNEISSGKLIDHSGNVYSTVDERENSGRFVKGKLNGKVKVQYANGNLFEGYYVEGKRSGQGKMIYMDLRSYEDMDQSTALVDINTKTSKSKTLQEQQSIAVKKNEITDQGEYIGMWKRDLREGFGVLKWYDGAKYEGRWHKDMRCEGKMTMADGTVYEGKFLNDKFHGRGKISMRFSSRNGNQTFKVFEGFFENGIVPIEGKIYITDKPNEVYYGPHDQYEKSGIGIMFYADGTKYQGMFQEDKREGVGLLYYPNGDFYYGEFQNDKKEGVGRIYLKSKNDRIYEGNWSKDEKNGEGFLIEPAQNSIIKSVWRSGKLDGKTIVLQMKDIGQIMLLKEKGIDPNIDLQNAFKIPYSLKALQD